MAEYLNVRCQLCRIHRSVPQSQLALSTRSLPTRHAFSASLRYKFNSRFNNGLLCPHCHHSIPWLPAAFDVDIAAGITLPIQAASYYDYPIRQAIRAFKHHEDMTKLPLLLHALRQLPRPNGCHHNNSVIIPMPTTHSRLVKRGFDPVTILSAYLSQHWKIPLWHGVQRIDNASSQQGLTRAERLSNLNDAFAVTKKPPVKRLLLFDDVATTGASLQALGLALYNQSIVVAEVNFQNPPDATNAYQLSAYALAHGSQ